MVEQKRVKVPHVSELLAALPSNWGRWGAADEVGALNHLGALEILRGVSEVRQGKTFTLQTPMADPAGDPIWPGRESAKRVALTDRSSFESGTAPPTAGGHEFADDTLTTHLHGTTHTDALGHVWYGDHIYNGHDASTTAGLLSKASVQPIAEKGIVGRGVLIDMARHRGKAFLDRGETFDHRDLMDAARRQGVAIEKRDIIVIRTGWVGKFFREGRSSFYEDFREPGLTFSRELVSWFADMEIPNLVTDTIANEVAFDDESGVMIPLHCALMRNLGIAFTEIVQLDALAADCVEDGYWTFLYVAAPLKVVGASAGPVNPVVIK